MDLDTNVKKFKYSPLCRALCIVLCLLTAMSACLITGAGAMALAYNASGDQTEKDWTATDEFEYHLRFAAADILGYTLHRDDAYKLREELEAAKNTAVSSLYDTLSKDIAERTANIYGRDNDEYFDDNGKLRPDTSIVFSELFPYDDYPCVTVSTENFGDYEFVYEWDDNIPFSTLFQEISVYYDAYFVNTQVDTYSNDYEYLDEYYTNNVCFYIEKDGEADNQNITQTEVSQITSRDIYLIIENGKITDSNGISSKTLDHVISNLAYFENASYTLYLYIDTEGRNWFTFYHEWFDLYQQINDSFYQLLALDILCIVLSFFLAFYYFGIAGRKKEDEPARLWFIDYVPLEIQTAAVGGMGYGVFILFFTIVDRLYDFELCVLAYTLLCFACWLLLFGLSSSVARYIHSDKKFYRHLSTYWVFFAIFKALGFVLKGTARLGRKTKASVKHAAGLLRYKPGNFKRNVILLTTLYFAVNFLLILLIVAIFFALPPFAVFMAFADLAGNIVIINKILKYIKDLDTIITASAQHTDIAADLDTLPQSLRILAESMKYTNNELQQAVNQAVKDERLRTELITNVSHDLKTPLTSIITYVDLLSKCDIEDDKAREYIAVLDEKGAKLKRLIDDLIEASKVTSGNITVNSAPMNLSELCLQATVDAQSDFEKAGLALIVKQGETPTSVFADGAKTFRIVENLLSNARKYSATHSRVYVSVYEEGNTGVFEIKNVSAQPLDISPDELTERFVRGDKSRNQDGNGLGLSIAKELCRVQNGDMEITIDGDLFKVKVKLPKSPEA